MIRGSRALTICPKLPDDTDVSGLFSAVWFERVEQLDSILHIDPFGDGEGLHRRQIEVAGAGAGEDVALRGSVGPAGVYAERFLREPLRDLLAARPRGQRRLRDNVGEIVADEAAGVIHAGRDRKRESRLPVPDAAR